MLVFFCLFLLVKSEGPKCCELDTPDGLINLKPLVHHYFDIKPFILGDHDATVRFCENLDTAHECKGHTDTVGPQPTKDEEEQGTCYYMGSLDQCSISEYESTSKTFKLSYPGVESQESPPQIRDMAFLMICSNDTSNVGEITDCEQSFPVQSKTVTTCKFTSRYCCPGYSPGGGGGGNFFETWMGAGGIVLIVLIAAIIVYIIVGIIVFIIRKAKNKDSPEEIEFREIILLDKIVLGFFVLIWEGILLIWDGISWLFKKIFKKGDYDQLES